MEEWRTIKGTWMEVSSLGRVRNPKTNKVYRQTIHKDTGYLYAVIPVTPTNGKRHQTKSYRTHLLVAEAFLGSRPNGTQVNHIDRNRLNNAAANLEYVTHKQNIRWSVAAGRLAFKLKSNDLAHIKSTLKAGFLTHREIAHFYDVNKATIGRISRGQHVLASMI